MISSYLILYFYLKSSIRKAFCFHLAEEMVMGIEAFVSTPYQSLRFEFYLFSASGRIQTLGPRT